MKTTDINDSLIGKRCKCIFFGLMVTGTIEEIGVNKYTAEVKVRFDEPHRWGNEVFEYDFSSARLCDEFGSLHHLEIIDNKYKTAKVTFSQSIQEIDKTFALNYRTWGVVNLKEWIDNYETSRYTQIDDHTAIITSEYNMEHIAEWLLQSTVVKLIDYII